MDIVNHGEKEGWIRIEVTLTAEEAAADVPFIITTLGMQSGVRPQKGRSGKDVLVEALGEENVANFIDNALMRKYIGASFDQAGVDVVGEPVYQCLKTYEEGEKYQFVLMGALKPTMSLSSYGPVAKGSLSQVRMKCARSGCRACKSGRGHPAWIFAYRVDGRRKCLYVRKVDVPKVKAAIERGRRVEALLLEEGVRLIESLRAEADAH